MLKQSIYSTSIFNLEINFKKVRTPIQSFKPVSYIMLPCTCNSRQYNPSKWSVQKSDQILKVNVRYIYITDSCYVLLLCSLSQCEENTWCFWCIYLLSHMRMDPTFTRSILCERENTCTENTIHYLLNVIDIYIITIADVPKINGLYISTTSPYFFSI